MENASDLKAMGNKLDTTNSTLAAATKETAVKLAEATLATTNEFRVLKEKLGNSAKEATKEMRLLEEKMSKEMRNTAKEMRDTAKETRELMIASNKETRELIYNLQTSLNSSSPSEGDVKRRIEKP